jgi:hypothetical protein
MVSGNRAARGQKRRPLRAVASSQLGGCAELPMFELAFAFRLAGSRQVFVEHGQSQCSAARLSAAWTLACWLALWWLWTGHNPIR